MRLYTPKEGEHRLPIAVVGERATDHKSQSGSQYDSFFSSTTLRKRNSVTIAIQERFLAESEKALLAIHCESFAACLNWMYFTALMTWTQLMPCWRSIGFVCRAFVYSPWSIRAICIKLQVHDLGIAQDFNFKHQLWVWHDTPGREPSRAV
jgi:hypothetical protein